MTLVMLYIPPLFVPLPKVYVICLLINVCGHTKLWVLPQICQVSECYTTVLVVVVDGFLQGRPFIPFKSLSALQVAEALFQHMFHLYGLLENVLSNLGSPFVFRE